MSYLILLSVVGGATLASPTPVGHGLVARSTIATSTLTGDWPDAGDEGDWGDSAGDSVGFGEPLTADRGGEAEGASSDGGPSIAGLSLSGFFRSDHGVWAERRRTNPWAKSRQSLDFELRYRWRPADSDSSGPTIRLVAAAHGEYDLAYLRRRGSYDQPTLEAYEWQVQPRELYVGVRLGAVELTVGRQIVAWGQGELLGALDVVNPRDTREPGLTDIDDLRLAILAVRLAVLRGDHSFEVLTIHEAYFGLQPAPRSEFSVLKTVLFGDDALGMITRGKEASYTHQPGRFALRLPDVLGRWQYKGPGLDLEVIGGRLLDPMGVVAPLSAANFTQPSLQIGVEHRPYLLLGQSGAVPAGNFVLRWELFAHFRRTLNVVNRLQEVPVLGEARASLLGYLFGVTYAGIENTSIGLEYLRANIVDAPWRSQGPGNGQVLLFPIEQPQLALRVSSRLLGERLSVDAAAVLFGLSRSSGWMARLDIGYLLVEGLAASLGYAVFAPGGQVGPLLGFESHDRILASLRWDFLVL